MPDYRPRIADTILDYRLEEMGAVVIEGPKWCGKTTTARQKTNSTIFLSDPVSRKQYMEMLQIRHIARSGIHQHSSQLPGGIERNICN